MRTHLVLIFLILSAGAIAATQHHMYVALILREPNNSLNYSKIPWVLIGVTPNIPKPDLLQYDTIVPVEDPPRLDPRTCPGDIAVCYQIREHNFTGELTYGKNYSATSSYILPEKRARMFYCVGNDTSCVQDAKHCFCLESVPKAERITPSSGRCSDTMHLCKASYASFAICEGNFTDCSEQFTSCGCGRYSVCAHVQEHACLNNRGEFTICQDKLISCIKKFRACFCGKNMMQIGCESKRNICTRDGKEHLCYGSFNECALKYDTCEC